MVNNMTNQEAIKRLRERICWEKPVQHFCTDNCMHGTDECEVAMAIKALKKQIPMNWMSVGTIWDGTDEYEVWRCPNCVQPHYKPTKYCPYCGQALKWEEKKGEK